MHDRSISCAFQPQVDMLGIHVNRVFVFASCSCRSYACFENGSTSLISTIECIVVVAVCMHGTHGMHPECFALDCVSGSAVRLYFGVFPPYFLVFREFFESYLTGAFSMMRISHAFFPRIYFHVLLCFQRPHAPCSLPCPEVFF